MLVNPVNSVKFNNTSNVKNNNITMPSMAELKNNPSFKGKEPSAIAKLLAKTYGEFILNNKGVRKFCEWLSKLDKNDASRHFQGVGAFVTSAAYMMGSLKNKDIEKKNGRTLAINQCLGFIVPTVAAYTVDAGLRGINKSLEYAYSGQNEKKIALAKMSKKDSADALKTLNSRLKGFRTLIGIITFTTIYRYAAPVLITPVANKIGNWVNGKIDAKQAQKEQEKLAQESNLAVA